MRPVLALTVATPRSLKLQHRPSRGSPETAISVADPQVKLQWPCFMRDDTIHRRFHIQTPQSRLHGFRFLADTVVPLNTHSPMTEPTPPRPISGCSMTVRRKRCRRGLRSFRSFSENFAGLISIHLAADRIGPGLAYTCGACLVTSV